MRNEKIGQLLRAFCFGTEAMFSQNAWKASDRTFSRKLKNTPLLRPSEKSLEEHLLDEMNNFLINAEKEN
jgi:hypothetical protein